MTETNLDETLDAYDGNQVESVTEATSDTNPSGEPDMTEQIVNQDADTATEPVPVEKSFDEVFAEKLAEISADANAENPEDRNLSFTEHLFAQMVKNAALMWQRYATQIADESKKVEKSTISASEWRKLREASDDPEVKAAVAEMAQLEERLREVRKFANSKVAPDDLELPEDEKAGIKENIKQLKTALRSSVDSMAENAAVNGGYGLDFFQWYKENSPNIRTVTRAVDSEGNPASTGGGRPKVWETLRVNGRDVERIQFIINKLDSKGNEPLGRIKVTNAQLQAWREELGQHFTVPGTKQTVTMVKVGEENDGSGWQ